MKFSDINTQEIHPTYQAVSLSRPARLPYKQALSIKNMYIKFNLQLVTVRKQFKQKTVLFIAVFVFVIIVLVV